VADDERHGTPVAPFQRARFLLPHHAGGRASFLTPSRIDCPDLRVDERVFATVAPGQRPPHTVFHGFVITNPGEPRGTTYYYNTLALLAAAFRHRHGPRIGDGDGHVAELARFSLGNLRRSRAGQPIHRSRYVTLGALLGSPELAHHVMPSGPRAESELWPEQYIQLPQLCDMIDRCPCGLCPKIGHRLLCHASMQTLGASWPAVRAAYEVGVVGERYDLLVGNNLTLLHGADSELRRTIQPLGLAIDQPDSDAYERWLAGQWRAWREPGRAAQERAA